jgi:DNA-binding transcriptional regulator YiaG
MFMGLQMQLHDQEPIGLALRRFKKLIEQSGMQAGKRQVIRLTASLVVKGDGDTGLPTEAERNSKPSASTRSKSTKPTKSQTKKTDVTSLRDKYGITQEEFARIMGYSLRSIAGWEAGRSLTAGAGRKLAETRKLLRALSEIIQPGELANWLRTANPAFKGKSPIQLLEEGNADRLWRMIAEIDGAVAG